jgi:hypothetical protein
MTDANVSRLGQINATGGSYENDNALFLKVFSGEVMTAFAQKTIMMGRHMVRTITSGKSAQFPVIGRTSARYHTPGTVITGKNIQHNEKIIAINDLLLSDVFISNIDEAKNHYDVRSIYSNEMGIALANQMDRHVLQTGIQAAKQTTPTVDSEADMVGTVHSNTSLSLATGMEADADDLRTALFAAARTMDEKNVPEDGRFCVLKPEHYYLLANGSTVVNGDFAQRNQGGVETGRVFMVAGIEILKSNNLPTTNITTGNDAGDAEGRQAVDASNTIGLVMHPSAVGTVKLMDLSTEMEYMIERQGTLAVAKYACGHGELRPEATVLLTSA